jgi:transcriptional regulator with XRE-family HTH domain
MTTGNRNETIHHGRNVKRFREMLNIKQEGLAISLGDDWNQKKISLLEQKEVIEDDVLEEVAKVLKVPMEAIKNFDAQAAIYNIQNNYEGSNIGVNSGAFNNHHCNFNPIDKIVELYESKIELYKRMLKDKSDMIEKLEELLLKGKA